MQHVPKHVAIIMDGNGRWARQRGLPRIVGHKLGLDAVKQVIDASIEWGIEHLTLWALSRENVQSRPQYEIQYLYYLLEELLKRELDTLVDKGVRIRFIGEKTALPDFVQKLITKAEQCTASNTTIFLNVALNYSGRWHLVEMVNGYLDAAADNKKWVQESDFVHYVETVEKFSDPDLLIRTGGEKRLSNFMLWSLSWTELYFSDLMWPEFDRTAYQAAMVEYCLRERRYGVVSVEEEA